MRNYPRFLASMLILGCAASCATGGLPQRPAKPDPARLVAGEWTGTVSWSNPVGERRETRRVVPFTVFYVWCIDPDGRFTSGRQGRGQNGRGKWRARGTRLTLKYGDGFRYEGEVTGDRYHGPAYSADGRSPGSFAMQRTAGDARDPNGPCGI